MITRTLALVLFAFGIGLLVGHRYFPSISPAPVAKAIGPKVVRAKSAEGRRELAAPAVASAGSNASVLKAGEDRPRYSEKEKARRMMQTAVNRAGLVVDMDRKYGDLFRALKLTPEAAARLRQLLASRENIPFLVETAIENDGMAQDAAMAEELTESENAKLDVQMKEVLGEDGYNKFIDYKNSMYQQGVATEIETRLRNLRLDLSDDQRQVLVNAHLQAEPTPFQSPAWNSDVATFDRYFQEQDAILQSVLTTVGSKLSNDQRAEIQRYYEEKLEPLRKLRELNAQKVTSVGAANEG
jgi:hypothetical protein